MTSNSNLMARSADFNSYLPLSNRNYVVDGNFDNWINTSVAVTAGTFSSSAAAMFYAGSGTGGASTITRQAWNQTEPVGMASPATYYYRHQQTTAATTAPAIQQHVENVLTCHGRSATFSCWLWVSTGAATITSISATQGFGTGGSTAVSVAVAVNWVLTTTPQFFSVRLDMPSTAGKTIGAGNYINLTISLPIGSTYTVNTTQWQFEQCSPQAPATGFPTAFEYRGAQAENARVRRYFEILTGMYGVGCISTATIAYGMVTYDTKRTTPTLTPSGPSSMYMFSMTTGNQILTTVPTFAAYAAQALFNITCSGATAGQPCLLENYSNSYITVDARL